MYVCLCACCVYVCLCAHCMYVCLCAYCMYVCLCRCIKLRYDTIREVHKRRYLLRHCAVEVFALDGRSHFLIFQTLYRDKVCQK